MIDHAHHPLASVHYTQNTVIGLLPPPLQAIFNVVPVTIVQLGSGHSIRPYIPPKRLTGLLTDLEYFRIVIPGDLETVEKDVDAI